MVQPDRYPIEWQGLAFSTRNSSSSMIAYFASRTRRQSLPSTNKPHVAHADDLSGTGCRDTFVCPKPEIQHCTLNYQNLYRLVGPLEVLSLGL